MSSNAESVILDIVAVNHPDVLARIVVLPELCTEFGAKRKVLRRETFGAPENSGVKPVRS
jgi:hypothetical protein